MDGRKEKEDVVLIYGADEESGSLKVLRKRGERIEPGVVRPAEPEQPIMGDLVRLKPRPGLPFLCDVETILEFSEVEPSLREEVDCARARSGPPMYATEAYRRGWERIFGQGKVEDSDVC